MPPKKPRPGTPPKPGKPPVGGAGIKRKKAGTAGYRKTTRAAKIDAKDAFKKASKDQKSVFRKAGKILPKDEIREAKAIAKELKTGKIEVDGKMYDFGKQGDDFKTRSARGNYEVDKAVIDKIRREQGPVAAREYEAFQEARKEGKSVAEANKLAKQAAKEEAASQKRIADKKAKSSVTEKAAKDKVVKDAKPKGGASRITKPVEPLTTYADDVEKSINAENKGKGLRFKFDDSVKDILNQEKPAAKKAAKKTAKKSLKDDIKKLDKEFNKKSQALADAQEATKAPARDFTKEIKDIEKKMSINSQDAKKGFITTEEKKRLNAKLAEQKNALQAEAKKAGAKVVNPADRPARNPKPKAEAPKVKQPKVTVKAVDSKTAKVIKDFEDGKISKSERNTKLKELRDERAKAMNEESKKPKSKTNKPKNTKTTKPKVDVKGKALTEAQRKTAAKEVVKAVAKKEAASAGGLAKSISSKLVGGKGGFMKKLGWLGVALTAKDIFDAAIEYDKANPPKLPKKSVPNLTVQQMLSNQASKYNSGPTSIGGMTLPGVKIGTPVKGVKNPNRPKANKKLAKNAAAFNKSKGSEPMPLKLSMVTGPKATVKPKPILPKTPNAPKGNGKFGVMKNGVYIVDRGDTLWDLSRKYGTTVDAIYKANPLLVKRKKAGTTQIFRGTQIKIPTK